MNKNLLISVLLGLLLVLLFSSSCASIVSTSKYDVEFKTIPTNASVRIFNENGLEIASAQTPTTLKLKASNGFFRAATYRVVFSKEGYKDKQVFLDASLDPWYFGNLIFGSIVGFLIIDPASGAMWKIDETNVSISLEPLAKPVAVVKDDEGKKALNVYALSDIPIELRKHMEPIKTKQCAK